MILYDEWMRSLLREARRKARSEKSGRDHFQLRAIKRHFPAANTITDLVEVRPGKYEVQS